MDWISTLSLYISLIDLFKSTSLERIEKNIAIRQTYLLNHIKDVPTYPYKRTLLDNMFHSLLRQQDGWLR